MKDEIGCSFCGGIATLISDFNDIYVGKINKKIWVNFHSYKCSCGESYTTTEIDELNLTEISKGIRKYKRMIKINNIVK